MCADKSDKKLPAVQFEGSDPATRLIRGTVLKCVDGRWSAKDCNLAADQLYLCLGTTQALQCWQDGMPSETILKEVGKALPDVDELNEQTPHESWEKGLDGKPRPPWQRNFVAYLVRISDAAAFTYLNSTFGAKIAVGYLTDQVKRMSTLRGINVVPIIRLSSAPMSTDFGQKMRPHFEIVDWREIGGGEIDGGGDPTPQIEPPKKGGAAEQIGRSVEPVTLKEEMNDEIGF
jgi:hypothetical protein